MQDRARHTDMLSVRYSVVVRHVCRPSSPIDGDSISIKEQVLYFALQHIPIGFPSLFRECRNEKDQS